MDFGREVAGSLAVAESREWLCANGLGGFASGTVAGLPTRRYHGLLVAALTPPVGRTVLVTGLEERVGYDGQVYELSTARWADGTVAPQGYRLIERFHLDGTTPVWHYACADTLIEKRVWMEPGANTTYVGYRLSAEEARGLDALDDSLHAGTFVATLGPDRALAAVLSVEARPDLDGEQAWARRRAHETEVLLAWRKVQPAAGPAPAWIERLVLAAAQFVVRRPLAADPAGLSVIAG